MLSSFTSLLDFLVCAILDNQLYLLVNFLQCMNSSCFIQGKNTFSNSIFSEVSCWSLNFILFQRGCSNLVTPGNLNFDVTSDCHKYSIRKTNTFEQKDRKQKLIAFQPYLFFRCQTAHYCGGWKQARRRHCFAELYFQVSLGAFRKLTTAYFIVAPNY